MKPALSVLRSLNCDGRRGLALLGACAVLLLAALTGEAGRALLRYERGALAAGQWWRLLTAHVVHLDIRHALLNSLGLALLWALFARDYSPRQWGAVVLGAMAAIDAGLWLCDSTLLWYVGSSGALHGVMAAGALAHVRRGQRDGAARDETGLRALAGGAAVLRARHGGGECAPVRGDRGHRRGRVPEAPQSAAIISAPGFGR